MSVDDIQADKDGVLTAEDLVLLQDRCRQTEQKLSCGAISMLSGKQDVEKKMQINSPSSKEPPVTRTHAGWTLAARSIITTHFNW